MRNTLINRIAAAPYRYARILVLLLFVSSVLGWTPGMGILPLEYVSVQGAADPVIAAAGDIACDPTNANFNNGNGTTKNCRQKYTSDLLVNAGLAAVLDLGDNQYYCGGYQAYLQSYDLSWGRVKAITHPAIGNHEYLTSGGTDCTIANAEAAGHFRYFGAAAGTPGQGYYSFDVGAWHIIALNSNCTDAGGCSATTPQGRWLEADLSAHPTQCILAYWHIPLFSSGGRDAVNSKSFWQTLYNHKADLVLVGHDHIYERFAPQTPDGVPDPVNGIRQITVGTGGSDHTSVVTVAANSEVRDATTYGVLKVTLHANSYDWQFVPEAGGTFTDAGTAKCHTAPAAPPDTTKPSAPARLTASAPASNQVNLSWTASTDNVGVTGYQVIRDGVQIATTTGVTYTDNSVQAKTAYSYTVTARDAAGNVSNPSPAASVTTPALPTPSPTPTTAPIPTIAPTPTTKPTAVPTPTTRPSPPPVQFPFSLFLPDVIKLAPDGPVSP